MPSLKNQISVCATLLEMYKEAESVHSSEIKHFQAHKAQRYALTNIYSFLYKGIKYYVSDDYSLGDNPVYVENLIVDINHTLKGSLVKNPITQSDGAVYALGLNSVEYYLWKCS